MSLSGRLRLRSLDNKQSAGRRFSPSSGWSDSAVDLCSEHNGQELRPCQVVKERGYLEDNLCCSIISVLREREQGETGCGPEDASRNGKRKVRELCGPDGARRSIAMTSGAVSF